MVSSVLNVPSRFPPLSRAAELPSGKITLPSRGLSGSSVSLTAPVSSSSPFFVSLSSNTLAGISLYQASWLASSVKTPSGDVSMREAYFLHSVAAAQAAKQRTEYSYGTASFVYSSVSFNVYCSPET